MADRESATGTCHTSGLLYPLVLEPAVAVLAVGWRGEKGEEGRGKVRGEERDEGKRERKGKRWGGEGGREGGMERGKDT